MKIYIVQDMEGVSCVTEWEHDLAKKGPDRVREARLLMTREMNAAVQGAREGGATEVYVHESHHFIVEELHRDARYVMGSRYLRVDKSFSGMFIIGQHSRARTADGVLAHSWSDRVREMLLNGEPVGEIGLWAAYAGCSGVPVILVTGDEAATREACELLGKVEVAAVKKGLGIHSAICLSPVRSQELIREKACEAVRDIRQYRRPYRVKKPVELSIEFHDPAVAERCMVYPGVRRLDATTVAFKSNDFLKVFEFRQFQAMVNWW